MKNRRITVINVAALITSTAIFPSLALASAFQQWEQSAISSGVAHADMASAANNASTAFYNPAGMTRLDSFEMSAGVSWAEIATRVYDASTSSTSTTRYSPDSTAYVQPVIPNFHVVLPVDIKYLDDFRLGLSVVSPFGAETLYDNKMIEAYAQKTYEEVISINPSLAFKLTEKLSFGAGVEAQQLNSVYSAQFYASTLYPEDELSIKGRSQLSDWKASWNVGLLYEFTPATRIGASYRPQVDHSQDGYYTASINNDNPVKRTVDATSELNLPAYTSFGFYHDFNNRVSVMANAVYTQWDSVQNVKVDVDSIPGFEDLELGTDVDFEWKNSWFLSVGGTYKATEKVILRTGLGYDRTPTTDKTREMRVPDSDRYHFAAGLGYTFFQDLQVDLAYQFVYTPQVDASNPFVALPIGGNAVYSSSVKSHGNILSLQFTWPFSGYN